MTPESDKPEVHYMANVTLEDAKEFDLEATLIDALTPKPQVIRNIVKQRVPKLSADEQNARRVLKRHKRARARVFDNRRKRKAHGRP